MDFGLMLKLKLKLIPNAAPLRIKSHGTPLLSAPWIVIVT
jgi:hypothetical protein